jgi:hypothetical protein
VPTRRPRIPLPPSTIRSARLPYWAVALTALFLFACSDGTSPERGGDDQLTLSVRVHLLQDAGVPSLNTSLSDSEVRTLFDGANGIWEQGDVVWQIESIVREEPHNGEDFARALRGELPLTPALVASLLPADQLLDGGWDVYFVRDFGGLVGGIYISGGGVSPAVISSEVDPTGLRDLAGSGPRILAHELGHSLSLFHVACSDAGNLMAPGCPRGQRTQLTTGQVDMARLQASTGHPFGN